MGSLASEELVGRTQDFPTRDEQNITHATTVQETVDDKMGLAVRKGVRTHTFPRKKGTATRAGLNEARLAAPSPRLHFLSCTS